MIRLSLSSRLKPVALVLMLVTGSPAVAGAAVNTATLIAGSASPSCNITRLATTVGVGMKQFEALPGFDALKQALPIVQALLEMMVIIAISCRT